MNLKPSAAGDAPALASLHALAFEAPWSASEIAGLLGGAGGFALAAWETGGLAGFILCRTIADEAEVMTLATAPAFRRRGVARALLKAATRIAEARGAIALFLEVASDNAAAIALYQGAGFSQVGVRAHYYVSGGGAVDAMVFRRDRQSSLPPDASRRRADRA